ncbi:MAG: hypothetical protein U0941_22075 [Planctomycetaceae bacterium]
MDNIESAGLARGTAEWYDYHFAGGNGSIRSSTIGDAGGGLMSIEQITRSLVERT